MLSDEAIEEFRKLYKKHYKTEISIEEARRRGGNLINLFKVIYRPIPKESNKDSDKKSSRHIQQERVD